VARSGPPAYAWDWFSRQRLLWRETRSRLLRCAEPLAGRYHGAETRGDVLALLREDYGREEIVRGVVADVVGEVAFLGRTRGRFADLGTRAAPRGMRWWWTALTGEDLDAARPKPPLAVRPVDPAQLSLDDVQQGYGG
jgi:hypothetical protein